VTEVFVAEETPSFERRDKGGGEGWGLLPLAPCACVGVMSNDVNMQRAIFASLQVAHETFVHRFVDVVEALCHMFGVLCGFHELNVTEVMPLCECYMLSWKPLAVWCTSFGALARDACFAHTRAKPPDMRTPRRGPELSPGTSAAPGSRLSAAVFEHICARSVPQRARTRAGARSSCKANSDGASF
jgi:hypothetical protein